MECCQVAGIEEYMGPRMAAMELEHYRKKGAVKTTRLLLDALKSEGVEGMTLLDIGGGVGVLQHELLKAGAKEAISVDASRSYLEAAQEEARRQGHMDRLRQHHGDFVELAGKLPEADVVTLDRVICCYDDMEKLVGLSAERALKFYGVVYPPDHWLLRLLTWLENLYHRVRRSQFRAFMHATEAVDTMIRNAGLERCYTHETLLWHVHVYRRPSV
ncbi:MAG: methyltransferase domain-containing protein [Anaerolineales bacterium]|nr:methyltransferase domain-containing protein [Anaerolineales bacterium]